MTYTPDTNAHHRTAWKIDPADYDRARARPYTVPEAPESVYVRMRDGVRLAVDVFRPAQGAAPVPGRFPTILVFTPYFRRFAVRGSAAVEASPNTARYRDLFTPCGYNVVVVDVRGTGASFGHREGFRSPVESNDYVDVAGWVCEQDWSNGELGVTGISYLGAAADFLASTGHPGVKAIAPLFSVWDTYDNNYFPGGIQLHDLIDSYGQLMIGLDQDDREAIAPFASYANPAFDGPAPVDADGDGELRDQAVHEHRHNYRHADMMREFAFREKPLAYDPEYSSASFSPYFYSSGMRTDVAIYSVSGWVDGAGYCNGAITRFLTKHGNPHHLLLGPWDHGARSDVSPWRENDEADGFWWAEILRFFDHYLLGMRTGLESEEPVHYFTMHAQEWRSAPAWPVTENSVEMVLSGSSTLAHNESAATEHGVVEHQVDYGTGTGKNTRYERIAGQHVQAYYSDWQSRTDSHSIFDSGPLEQDLDVSGHVVVSLKLSSSEPDATVFVYLTEVEADGSERYVTEGLLRLLHRKESSRPAEFVTTWPYRSFREDDAKPMPAGQSELVRIPMLPTSWRFSRGSRIRLSIAGADSDHATQTPHGRPPVLGITVGIGESSIALPVEELSEAGTSGRVRVAVEAMLKN